MSLEKLETHQEPPSSVAHAGSSHASETGAEEAHKHSKMTLAYHLSELTILMVEYLEHHHPEHSFLHRLKTSGMIEPIEHAVFLLNVLKELPVFEHHPEQGVVNVIVDEYLSHILVKQLGITPVLSLNSMCLVLEMVGPSIVSSMRTTADQWAAMTRAREASMSQVALLHTEDREFSTEDCLRGAAAILDCGIKIAHIITSCSSWIKAAPLQAVSATVFSADLMDARREAALCDMSSEGRMRIDIVEAGDSLADDMRSTGMAVDATLKTVGSVVQYAIEKVRLITCSTEMAAQRALAREQELVAGLSEADQALMAGDSLSESFLIAAGAPRFFLDNLVGEEKENLEAPAALVVEEMLPESSPIVPSEIPPEQAAEAPASLSPKKETSEIGRLIGDFFRAVPVFAEALLNGDLLKKIFLNDRGDPSTVGASILQSIKEVNVSVNSAGNVMVGVGFALSWSTAGLSLIYTSAVYLGTCIITKYNNQTASRVKKIQKKLESLVAEVHDKVDHAIMLYHLFSNAKDPALKEKLYQDLIAEIDGDHRLVYFLEKKDKHAKDGQHEGRDDVKKAAKKAYKLLHPLLVEAIELAHCLKDCADLHMAPTGTLLAKLSSETNDLKLDAIAQTLCYHFKMSCCEDDFHGALKIAMALYAHDPSEALLCELVAYSQFRLGDHQAALYFCNEGLEKGSTEPTLLQRFLELKNDTLLTMIQGKLTSLAPDVSLLKTPEERVLEKEAILPLLEQAIFTKEALAQNTAELHALHASLDLSLGRMLSAKAHAAQAFELDSSFNAAAFSSWAFASLESNSQDEAFHRKLIEYCNKGLLEYPHDTALLTSLAVAHLFLKDSLAAQTYASRALSCDSKNIQALMIWMETTKTLQSLSEVACYEQGVLYCDQGLESTSDEDLNQKQALLTEKYQYLTMLTNNFAVVSADQKSLLEEKLADTKKQLLKVFQAISLKAFQDNEKNTEALKGWILSSIELGDSEKDIYQKAFGYCLKGLETFSEDPNLLTSQYNILLHLVHLAKDQPEEKIGYLQKLLLAATVIDQNTSSIYTLLAETHRELEQFEWAEKNAMFALEHDRTNFHALILSIELGKIIGTSKEDLFDRIEAYKNEFLGDLNKLGILWGHQAECTDLSNKKELLWKESFSCLKSTDSLATLPMLHKSYQALTHDLNKNITLFKLLKDPGLKEQALQRLTYTKALLDADIRVLEKQEQEAKASVATTGADTEVISSNSKGQEQFKGLRDAIEEAINLCKQDSEDSNELILKQITDLFRLKVGQLSFDILFDLFFYVVERDTFDCHPAIKKHREAITDYRTSFNLARQMAFNGLMLVENLWGDQLNADRLNIAMVFEKPYTNYARSDLPIDAVRSCLVRVEIPHLATRITSYGIEFLFQCVDDYYGRQQRLLRESIKFAAEGPEKERLEAALLRLEQTLERTAGTWWRNIADGVRWTNKNVVTNALDTYGTAESIYQLSQLWKNPNVSLLSKMISIPKTTLNLLSRWPVFIRLFLDNSNNHHPKALSTNPARLFFGYFLYNSNDGVISRYGVSHGETLLRLLGRGLAALGVGQDRLMRIFDLGFKGCDFLFPVSMLWTAYDTINHVLPQELLKRLIHNLQLDIVAMESPDSTAGLKEKGALYATMRLLAERDLRQYAHLYLRSLYAEARLFRRVEERQLLGDGNCLFRSISYYTTFSHEVLRAMTIQYEENHPGDFQPFFTEEGRLEAHLANLRRGGSAADSLTWGGEHEIRALEHVLERPIVVIQPDGSLSPLSETHFSKSQCPVFVKFHPTHQHYSAFFVRGERYFEETYREKLKSEKEALGVIVDRLVESNTNRAAEIALRRQQALIRDPQADVLDQRYQAIMQSKAVLELRVRVNPVIQQATTPKVSEQDARYAQICQLGIFARSRIVQNHLARDLAAHGPSLVI